MASKGITTGWSDNTLRPWRTCNRAAIMTFIRRYAEKPKASSFKDKTDNADFDAVITWASQNDIATVLMMEHLDLGITVTERQLQHSCIGIIITDK